MTNQKTKLMAHQENEEALQQCHEELLEALLEETVTYPWNPSAIEAENYFMELEHNFSLEEFSDSEEIAGKAENFFSHLDQCWSSQTKFRVKESLLTKFGKIAPVSWLEMIADQAEQIVEAKLSPLNQLVECIKPLLSNWAEEDLQVFARPLVYAMRGSREVATENALSLEKQLTWDDLSEIEQVRFSMEIANYALLELQAEN